MNVIWHDNDSSFTIEWDENDPIESVFNDWTEEDFLTAIRERCKEVLGDEEYEKIISSHQNDQQHQEELPTNQST
jgi:hypothetical protein